MKTNEVDEVFVESDELAQKIEDKREECSIGNSGYNSYLDEVT